MKKEIFESELYEELLNNPKPYTIPYFKQWGPVITHHNLNNLLEKLMVDYLMKKDVIRMYYDKYEPKRRDYDQMEMFEKELHHRLNKRPLKMEFLALIPDGTLKEQFDKVLADPDFECFMV